jgi:prepilin-type N-terminal cleavage/methylation domain-containing protein
MDAPKRLSQRGFTLIEVLVVLVVIGIGAAAVYVLQFGPSEATAGVVAMQRNLETFSVLETREFEEKGRYERPEILLGRGAMALSDRVEVDSVGYAADRVYLRLRHLDTEERCSVDLSAVSENARNYRQCFGGAAPDSLERPLVADGPGTELPDTAAVETPPAPPAGPVVRAPVVADPADLVVVPGGAVRQTFRVTNPGAVAREYRFTAASSDAGLVPAPAHPAGMVVGAGESVDVPVESSVAAGAAAGRASAVALEAVDAGDEALSGRGRFAVTAGAVLEAPDLAGPGPIEVEPGGTISMRWTVRNRSNGARLMELAPRSDDPSLAMVSVVGAGRLRLEPGASRTVEATFRLASPSTAGTTRSATLSARDVMAPAYRAAASVPVTTRLVVAAPAVAGPADRTENPGATFTATWTVANRSNAARRFTVTPGLDGASELVVESATGTGTVTIPEGGRLTVSVSYRLRSDAVAGTRNTASLRVADADAPELAATGSFTATTALVLAAPTVASPGDRSAGPGERFVVSWTVRNSTNGARVLEVAPGVAAGGELVVVASSGTGAVAFQPFETRTASVTYQVRRGSVGGSASEAQLEASDRDQPSYAGSSRFRFTTATVLRAPSVRSLGDRSGDPGSAGTAGYRLVNESNVRRTFRLVATSSNGSAVADPADPVQVAVEPFGSVDLSVPYSVDVRAVAGSTAALGLQATDAADGAWTGSAAATFTTNLVVKAPGVAGGGSVSGYSGETHSLVFPLTNRSNARRRISFSVSSSNGAVVPAPAAPAPVEVEPFATVEVTVPVRFGAAPSSSLESTVTVTAADAEAGGPGGSGAGGATRINRLPSLGPTAGPGGQYTYTTVQAAGNAADPDGTIVSYEWFTISPAGVWAYLGSAAAPATSFPKAGGWRFWVRVTDNNGGQASGYTDPVPVLNRVPAAGPTAAPDGEYTFVPVRLEANASDVDGTVTSYAWYTIDPGGAWTYVGGGASASFTPGRPGTWYAYVVATDDDGGQVGAYTAAISVRNRAPTAAPGFSPDGQPSRLPVQLHANAADPDGSVSGYAWYVIDPGGAWSYAGADANPSFVPGRPGAWRAYVVVTDDSGAQTGAYTGTIPVANRPPSVAPSFTPNNQPPGTPVQLYANGSDEDGAVQAYAWYVIDPGGGWTYVGAGANLGFTPNRGGTWYGYVVATDDLGAQTAGYTGPITVAEVYGCTDPGARNYNPGATANDGSCVYNRAPVAVLDVGYPGGQSFAWEGEAVSLDLRRSWDPDGDPLTGNLGSGLTGSASWGAEGTYYVTGTVSDGRATGSETKAVIVRRKIIGCMDPGARNHDPSANAPGTCVYSNAPPVITSFTLRNTTTCSTATGYGWIYRMDVSATDPDGDALRYRWVDRDGGPAWSTGSSLNSPCWLRAYKASGPAYVEVSDEKGGIVREYFHYTPLE